MTCDHEWVIYWSGKTWRECPKCRLRQSCAWDGSKQKYNPEKYPGGDPGNYAGLAEVELRALLKVWGDRIAEMSPCATYADIKQYSKRIADIGKALHPEAP